MPNSRQRALEPKAKFQTKCTLLFSWINVTTPTPT